MQNCTVPECDSKYYGKGYCNRHYLQIKKTGKILPDIKPYIFKNKKDKQKCKVLWCQRSYHAKHCCEHHWRYFKQYATVISEHFQNNEINKLELRCIVTWCENPQMKEQYCAAHWLMKMRAGKIKFPKHNKNRIVIKSTYAELEIGDLVNPEENVKFKVDICDVTKIKDLHWCENTGGYARNSKVGFLHRFVLNLGANKTNKMVVDHINRNIHDCRKQNLRIIPLKINFRNRNVHQANTSGYNGVCYRKDQQRWFARMEVSCKNRRDAIQIRKDMEKRYWG